MSASPTQTAPRQRSGRDYSAQAKETAVTTQLSNEINMEVLDALVGRVIGDFGSTASAALAVIGDRLGLYRSLAEIGPDSHAVGFGYQNRRALHSPLASQPGGLRVHHVRRRECALPAHSRAGDGLRDGRHTGLASRWLRGADLSGEVGA